MLSYTAMQSFFKCVYFLTAKKEQQLGTNTNLLTMLKSTFLAGLSIHIMACCWFAVSCKNKVTFSGSSSLTNTLCEEDSWAQSCENTVHLITPEKNTV